MPGRDLVDRDDDATDPPGPHGTAVAGVAAARGGNGFGGVGACFSCRLMPIRVLGLDGFALNTNIAAAIDYAVDHGAAVINISLYGPHSPPRLREAIVRARAAGVLVVAAAGNEGTAERQYPAAFPETVAVGAAATNEQLARSSSFGDWVDVAAPECAPLTAIGGATEVGCGTSVSAPLVAGIVGLMRAQAPFASAAQLEAALASTARPLDGVRQGFVDAAAALASLGSPGPSVLPVVFGRPATGRTLEAFVGLWSGAGLDVRYRWERCRGELRCDRRRDLTPVCPYCGRRWPTTPYRGEARTGGLDHFGPDGCGARAATFADPAVDRGAAPRRRRARRSARELGGIRAHVLRVVAALQGRVHVCRRRPSLPRPFPGPGLPVPDLRLGLERCGIRDGGQRADEPRRPR